MSATGMLEEWQLRQRAQKEAERRRKQEAFEAHKQFRGSVREEELKLRAIKEEERLKKLETESILRDYKGGVREDDLKLSAWKQEDRLKKAEAIANHREFRLSAEDIEYRERKRKEEQEYPSPVKLNPADPRDAIEEGAVNRLKENYKSPSPTNIKGFGSPFASPSYRKNGNVEHSPLREASVREGTVKAIAGSFDSVGSIYIDESKDRASPAVGASNSEFALETNDHGVVNGGATLIHLDVCFSFGVITAADTPHVLGYLKAVEQEVEDFFRQSQAPSLDASYDTKYPPVLKNVELDDTYAPAASEVRRFLVTAAVPLFLTRPAAARPARDALLRHLQESVRSGRLLALRAAPPA